MDGAQLRPTANPVLRRLDALVGEWDMLASMEGQPTVPSDIEVPPEWLANSPFPITSIIGLDLASETFFYLYADGRGVYRVYRMSLNDDEWKIWGQSGPDFFQRFSGTFSEDGGTITGHWEASRDGTDWQTDFDVTYSRAG
jgi:hypothetical protein